IASAQPTAPGVVPAAPAPASESGSRLPAIFADAPPGHPAAIDLAAPGGHPAGTACDDGQAVPFTPVMLGDFVGPVANLFTNFKIAEGESPRPMDRVFFKYNYYNNVNPTRWTDPTEPIHNVK